MEDGPGNALRSNAFRALFLFPFDVLRAFRPRPYRNADDHLVLDHDAPHDLRLRRILRRHAEQSRDQSKKGKQCHAERTIAISRSSGKR